MVDILRGVQGVSDVFAIFVFSSAEFTSTWWMRGWPLSDTWAFRGGFHRDSHGRLDSNGRFATFVSSNTRFIANLELGVLGFFDMGNSDPWKHHTAALSEWSGIRVSTPDGVDKEEPTQNLNRTKIDFILSHTCSAICTFVKCS